MIDETFLTTEEVLEYLQVNLRTVYRLIKAGKIPAVRVGHPWCAKGEQNADRIRHAGWTHGHSVTRFLI